jgi:hypothetical protein
MTGSRIVDIGLGLSFAFLLLSLLCSAIHEMFAAVVGLRASTLHRGIRRMLASSEGLRDAVYGHPLIASLGHGCFRWTRRPSYIPNDAFAAALVDVLKSPEKMKATAAEIEDVRRSLAALMAGTKVGAAVDREWQKVGDAVEKERQVVGRWFDDAMSRVAGAYKRSSQIVLFLVGLLVALATNVDSVTLTRSLWSDAALRDAVAAEAQSFVAEGGQEPAKPAGAAGFDQALDAANARFTKALTRLEALQLPVGWPAGGLRPGETPWSKVLGLLVTVVAISLGAPFWFDTLSRLSNLRSAGAKPASRGEAADGSPAARTASS